MKKKESLKDLEHFEIVYPAKELLDALIESADALAKSPVDEKRIRALRLVLGFQNSFLRAYYLKMNYHKTVYNMDAKVSFFKKKFKNKKK